MPDRPKGKGWRNSCHSFQLHKHYIISRSVLPGQIASRLLSVETSTCTHVVINYQNPEKNPDTTTNAVTNIMPLVFCVRPQPLDVLVGAAVDEDEVGVEDEELLDELVEVGTTPSTLVRVMVAGGTLPVVDNDEGYMVVVPALWARLTTSKVGLKLSSLPMRTVGEYR